MLSYLLCLDLQLEKQYLKLLILHLHLKQRLCWLADYRDIDGWDDTAQSWLVAAIVVSVLGAGLVFFIKWLKKKMAGVIKTEAWSRGETLLLMLLGLLPIFCGLLTIWYFSRDYPNIIGVGGLFKGVVVSWFLYVLLRVIVHAVSPWRHELL